MIFVRTKNENQSKAAEATVKGSASDGQCLVLGPKNGDYIFVESYNDLAKYVSGDVPYIVSGGRGSCHIILQSSIHIWNLAAVEAILSMGIKEFSFLASYELTEHELWDLAVHLPKNVHMILPVYGRIPLMYTKNCVKLTNGLCNNTSEFVKIRDRKRVDFPIYTECEKCRNIIYNSVPLSLHKYVEVNGKFGDIFLDFTDEDEGTVTAVTEYYLGRRKEFPVEKYTTGHFKKAVL